MLEMDIRGTGQHRELNNTLMTQGHQAEAA